MIPHVMVGHNQAELAFFDATVQAWDDNEDDGTDNLEIETGGLFGYVLAQPKKKRDAT